MPEIQRTDAEAAALSGQTLPAGIVLPTTGAANWYLAANRLLARIADALAATAAALEVYPDGALTCGVRPGTFSDGATARTYAGSTARPLTDDATNYIYLTAAGVLTINTAGFPDPAMTPHVPLATIVTAGGSYALADMTDHRARAMIRAIGS